MGAIIGFRDGGSRFIVPESFVVRWYAENGRYARPALDEEAAFAGNEIVSYVSFESAATLGEGDSTSPLHASSMESPFPQGEKKRRGRPRKR